MSVLKRQVSGWYVGAALVAVGVGVVLWMRRDSLTYGGEPVAAEGEPDAAARARAANEAPTVNTTPVLGTFGPPQGYADAVTASAGAQASSSLAQGLAVNLGGIPGTMAAAPRAPLVIATARPSGAMPLGVNTGVLNSSVLLNAATTNVRVR